MTNPLYWSYVEAQRTLEFEARCLNDPIERYDALTAAYAIDERLGKGEETAEDIAILEAAKARW